MECIITFFAPFPNWWVKNISHCNLSHFNVPLWLPLIIHTFSEYFYSFFCKLRVRPGNLLEAAASLIFGCGQCWGIWLAANLFQIPATPLHPCHFPVGYYRHELCFRPALWQFPDVSTSPTHLGRILVRYVMSQRKKKARDLWASAILRYMLNKFLNSVKLLLQIQRVQSFIFLRWVEPDSPAVRE